jgi:transcriptional regulator with XRE-family HTH domain
VPRQVEQAREALGARLREIRSDAGLSGRQLAALAGWHFTKVSKLENGKQHPSDGDLRAWCRHCQAPGETPDLIASAHSVASMYLEWRRQGRAGMRRPQKAKTPIYERARLFRIYEPALIPGLFQTAEYATWLLGSFIGFHDLPNDLDQAVAARLERQQLLYSGDRRFEVILEQQALYTRIGPAEAMAGQLDRLITLMSLQRVSLAIIPATAARHTTPTAGFWIFDEEMAQVETVSAELTVTQYREIALFAKKFDLLHKSAVTGPQARVLITQAMGAPPAAES